LKAFKSGECQTHPKKAIMIVLKQTGSGRMGEKEEQSAACLRASPGRRGNRGVRAWEFYFGV
jgi:hypothetical protein